jgi:hypothetical protein
MDLFACGGRKRLSASGFFRGFGLCGGDFLIGGFDLVRRAALPPFVGERLR